jgi:hypothetical protein
VNRRLILPLGIAAVLAETALIHGPLGTGERFAGKVEAVIRAELDRQEMPLVQARLERGPLRRRVILSGPADDFQRSELVRIIGTAPGVSEVRWANPPSAVAEVR